jgi:hypothetical protein
MRSRYTVRPLFGRAVLIDGDEIDAVAVEQRGVGGVVVTVAVRVCGDDSRRPVPGTNG